MQRIIIHIVLVDLLVGLLFINDHGQVHISTFLLKSNR